MKKIIFAAILLTGTVALANAQTPEQTPTTPTEQTAPEAGYKTVAIDSLSEVVQKTIATMAGDTCEVKTVEFDAAKELTKVTFVNKADQSEKVVILDKQGKEAFE